MKVTLDTSQMIPINELRKRFGEIEKRLPFVDHLILTKRGKPFAILAPVSKSSQKSIRKFAGMFKGTDLDKDELWSKVLIRKSRSKVVHL